MFGLFRLIYGVYEIIDVVRLRSQSLREDYIATEFDDEERYATVSLYSKVVEGFASSAEYSCSVGYAHHWALVVRFDDGSYRVLEGSPNDENFLHAHYKKYLGNGMTKMKELGRVRTSPARLRSIARQNSLNGSRYDLFENNCQDWAIRAAKDISPSIGRAASSVSRITPVLSVSRVLVLSLVNPVAILTAVVRKLAR